MRACTFGEAARRCAPAQWPAFPRVDRLEADPPAASSVPGTRKSRPVGRSLPSVSASLKSQNVVFVLFCLFVSIWNKRILFLFFPFFRSVGVTLTLHLSEVRKSKWKTCPLPQECTFFFSLFLLLVCFFCSFVLIRIVLPSTSLHTVLLNSPIIIIILIIICLSGFSPRPNWR